MFLENFTAVQALAGAGGLAGLIALGAVFMAFIVLIMLAVYVYYSFAFMAIARKTNYSSPGIAWIPFVGKALIASKAAKMHWWPVLLVIGFVIPSVGWLFIIAYIVFWTIWLWKTFEAVGRPGWWAILSLINILELIFVGIAAWGNAGRKVGPAKSSKARRR